MLSRPQNIRVGRVDNLEIFWPNIFTEETGLFFFISGYYYEIILDIVIIEPGLFVFFFFTGKFFTFTFSFHCKHGESVNLLALIKH